MTVARVPIASELSPRAAAVREHVLSVQPRSAAEIASARAAENSQLPSVADVLGDRPIDWERFQAPGRDGAPDVPVTVLRPRGAGRGAPGLYNIHGGGLIMGHPNLNTERIAQLIGEFGFVAVNVDYRLAPEHPDLAPAEDCYTGLRWMADNAETLGIDADRIVVMGASAGGCLTASMALMCRDRQGPRLAGQLVLAPMLDDRDATLSSRQNEDVGTWDRRINRLAWRAVLGDRVGAADVSPYVAPARATDLSGLAPAFIEVGSTELFRDEAVDYASRIWAAGGEAELHVWSGGFHSFEIYCSETRLARDALAARVAWLRRVLS
jgi:acetyl esterase/lipase